MATADIRRGRNGRQDVGAAWQKKPDGRDGQPDLRLVRPLRRGGDDAA